jgi:hypothetical protein
MSDARIHDLQRQVAATAGGFLRNLVTEGTCQRCYTPLNSGELCGTCRTHDGHIGLPDARGFMTYASWADPIRQSGRVMRGYKADIPVPSAERTVSLLTALAVQGHRDCPSHLAGTPLTAWAHVPSLPPKETEIHPLAQVLRALSRPGSSEIILRGIDNPENPRAVSASNFTVQSPMRPSAHVLLIDDTWTTGGHAHSATLALRTAGAAHVSLLVLARWLSPEWGDTTQSWIRTHLDRVDYDPTICPWTQTTCPS